MILVLGGTGLVGSHLLTALVKSGEPVRALKRTGSDLQQVKKIFSYYGPETEELFGSIEWVEGDLLDQSSLYEATEGINKLYHAAAIVSFKHNDKSQRGRDSQCSKCSS